MKLFCAYLKAHSKPIIVFLLFTVIFMASFSLYRLPIMAVLYPAVVCLLSGIGFVANDYCNVRKKHAQLLKIQAFITEISEQMPETENLLESDYQELIQMLEDRFHAAQTEGLVQYREMIDYYTIWAHQIKTPIAAMKLTLQNEDTPLSRRLTAELFRIEQYVEMVLAFLRLNSDSSDYVFRPYGLDEIIRSCIRKFASEFIDRRIQLEYTPIEANIVTDEKWFSFLIEQLLSNALKYTPGGNIRIYLAEPKSLCIADTGIGISPQDLPRVFEKGYTGYNGRMDKSASGIGLYLCQRICKNLGLEISIASESGKGTTVSIDLSQYGEKPE